MSSILPIIRLINITTPNHLTFSSRSNIFRAHSKKNAAENFESPRVVRTELRSSEPENAENGSWSGSKEWANKIYPLLKNQ